MRLLIYGMQSSGASTLALLFAQKPDSAAFIDIWAMYAAPAVPADGDVVAKVVITTTFPLALHVERFRPDRTILLLRHPEVNYRSLATKRYRHHCGFMEEKFALLDQVFAARSTFDAVLYYEDLVLDPRAMAARFTRLGWGWEPRYLHFARSYKEIRGLNDQRYPSLAGRLEYGMGKHRPGKLQPELANLDAMRGDGDLCTWCPAVTDHYKGLLRERGQTTWSSEKCIPRKQAR